jgi:hypothetical protein
MVETVKAKGKSDVAASSGGESSRGGGRGGRGKQGRAAVQASQIKGKKRAIEDEGGPEGMELGLAAGSGGEENKDKEKKDFEKQAAKKEYLGKEKVAKLLKTMVTSILRGLQESRDLAACVIDVMLAPAEAKFFETMKQATTNYSQLEQAAKEEAGPPHLQALMGLLDGLLEEKDKIGATNFEVISKYRLELKDMTTQEACDAIRMCRQFKCYKKEDRRLAFEITGTKIRKEIISAITQLGGKLKLGRDPATYLERDLAEWLQLLEVQRVQARTQRRREWGQPQCRSEVTMLCLHPLTYEPHSYQP